MARLWKNGENGEIVSQFSPIFHQFHTFFIHFAECTFGNFSQFPISPHFSIFPIFPSPCGWAANPAAANAEACLCRAVLPASGLNWPLWRVQFVGVGSCLAPLGLHAPPALLRLTEREPNGRPQEQLLERLLAVEKRLQ